MDPTRTLPLTELEQCCSPIASEPLSADNAVQLAHRLKALADPARLRLVSMIAAQPESEACVCDLTEPLGLTQGTVSHHLKVLREAGLVDSDKRGTNVYYRVNPGSLDTLSTLIGS